MSKRKFQDKEKALLNDKMPNYLKSSYGLKVGDEVVIYTKSYDGYYVEFIQNGQAKRFDVRGECLDKIKEKTKREQFLEQIEKAKERIEATKMFISETESKIKFMDETGMDDFNENEFKAYHTLLIIDKSNMSIVEKAKAIAKLISNK
jgi:bifunctional DNA-binding transcriptional regulator/antitoxin component of YhaV-PrlF toxin-antitoxin module